MTTYPNASFSLLDDQLAIARVRAAVERGAPWSMVRLGDGEGVAMSIGESSWLHDIGYLHSHWGAENVSLGDALRVRADLREAVRDADLVGIRPDLVGVAAPDDLLRRRPDEIRAFVRSDFHLRGHERESLSAASARRLAVLHDELCRFSWAPDQEFCSQWLHWELLASRALEELLAELDTVTVVSGRPELAGLLEARFGLHVRAVMVPDKYVDTRVSGAHVPDRYDRIRAELDVPPGTLALVGAGIPGKAYCHWVKEAGGVAVDIGSVMDAWIGKASRPQVLAARFGVPEGHRVPQELVMRRPTSSSRGLTPRWKPKLTLTESE